MCGVIFRHSFQPFTPGLDWVVFCKGSSCGKCAAREGVYLDEAQADRLQWEVVCVCVCMEDSDADASASFDADGVSGKL